MYRHFIKEGVQMSNKHAENSWTTAVNRETRTKVRTNYYTSTHTLEWIKFKRLTILYIDKDLKMSSFLKECYLFICLFIYF